MTTCKACGNEFRKGVLAFLLTPGGLKGARVCQSCAAGGVLLVASKLAPVIKQRNDDAVRIARALRQLRTLASASNASAGVDHREDSELFVGRAQGFEGAIEVLKRECGE